MEGGWGYLAVPFSLGMWGPVRIFSSTLRSSRCFSISRRICSSSRSIRRIAARWASFDWWVVTMLGMFCILAGRWVCLEMCGRAVDAYVAALQGNPGLVIAHHSVITVSQRREGVQDPKTLSLNFSLFPFDSRVRGIKNGGAAGHFHSHQRWETKSYSHFFPSSLLMGYCSELRTLSPCFRFFSFPFLPFSSPSLPLPCTTLSLGGFLNRCREILTTFQGVLVHIGHKLSSAVSWCKAHARMEEFCCGKIIPLYGWGNLKPG